MSVKTPVYLDYQATTPLDPRVLDAMLPFFTEKFGNPHSVAHRYGWEADAAIEVAREDIADVIGARADEIVFTSGATESNNLIIKGVMAANLETKPHLVTVATEHKCVLECAAQIGAWGGRVTYLPVESSGLIDLQSLEDAVTPETALVSVMAVNNEIGVVQPLAEIGEVVRAKGALFHTDAAQAFGKIPLDVDAMRIDFMSLSGHKIYGPKGIGAAYIRKPLQSELAPQMSGGGQQGGLRSGTLAPALCVGFGAAAKIAKAEMAEEGERIATLSRRFLETVRAALPDTVAHGTLERRYAGNLNLGFPGLDGDLLLANLRDLAVSSGAACASAETGPSYVLQALAVDGAMAKASLRIGFGRFTTEEDVAFAAERLIRVVSEMRMAA